MPCIVPEAEITTMNHTKSQTTWSFHSKRETDNHQVCLWHGWGEGGMRWGDGGVAKGV